MSNKTAELTIAMAISVMDSNAISRGPQDSRRTKKNEEQNWCQK